MKYMYHREGGIPPETESWVFVFGSNVCGVHGAGAALVAKNKYGAIQFKGEGLAGNSYAIPTKDSKIRTLPLSIVHSYVEDFKRFTYTHSELRFWVTAVGCGLAGYNASDIAGMFKGCNSNCSFSENWRVYLEEDIKNRLYCGVGSRETPMIVLEAIRALGRSFGTLGYTLRSGGAQGADTAFEEGCDDVKGLKEIYIPWIKFNGRDTVYTPNPEHYKIASTVHPAWDYLRPAARSLHARNVGQVLGMDCKTPVEFCVCYTEDGAQTKEEVTRKTGGTGTAIKLSSINSIPVYNLKRPESFQAVKDIVAKS